jgi:ankyrin repeat protein
MSSILPLPPAVVGEFVGRSHNDLARVTELVNNYPTVINAAFDWGNGDFETAIGAAAHSGRRDIVEFLLTRGARIDIFAAAFLGRLALVKAFLHETPGALHQAGPHGISLLEHAKKGGNPEMIAYLVRLVEPEKARAKAAKAKAAAKPVKAKRRKAA